MSMPELTGVVLDAVVRSSPATLRVVEIFRYDTRHESRC